MVRILHHTLTSLAIAAAAASSTSEAARPLGDFEHVVDLTHTLDSNFPYIPIPGITFPFSLEPIATLDALGVAANRWTIHEHLGTQIDAPSHFARNGRSLEQLRPDELFAPLVVIDIKDRAAKNPDVVMTVEDILAWEKAHGRVPDGACVVMNSGWGKFVSDPKRFIGLDREKVKHFPGIAQKTGEFLVRERRIWGVGVDVVSFDPGIDGTYQTHKTVLGADKWAIEAMANLDQVPASGATLIVGATKVRGATGGPVRLIAVW